MSKPTVKQIADELQAKSLKRRRMSRSEAVSTAYGFVLTTRGADAAGVLEDHLPKPHGYWTLERCKEDARRFRTKGEWANGGSSSGYQAAHRNGWLDDCCGHMVEVQKPHGYWTLERCKADALRFKTRSKWRNGSPSGYSATNRNGWLEECCGHMPANDAKPRGYWTLERCKGDALRFKTKVEWRNEPQSGYQRAKRNGWLEECCGHMPQRNQGSTDE